MLGRLRCPSEQNVLAKPRTGAFYVNFPPKAALALYFFLTSLHPNKLRELLPRDAFPLHGLIPCWPARSLRDHIISKLLWFFLKKAEGAEEATPAFHGKVRAPPGLGSCSGVPPFVWGTRGASRGVWGPLGSFPARSSGERTLLDQSGPHGSPLPAPLCFPPPGESFGHCAPLSLLPSPLLRRPLPSRPWGS